MKLIEALDILKRRPTDGRPFTVLFASGYTPLHVLSFLQAHLTLTVLDHTVAIKTGLYGDLAGTLARADAEPSDVVVIALEWPDLDPRLGIRHLGGWNPASMPELVREARARLAHLSGLVSEIARRRPAVVSVPTLPLAPAAFQPTWQLSPLQARLSEAMAQFAAELAGIPGVSILNSIELDRISPPAERHDVKAELSTGFPYRMPHAAALGSLLARLAAPPTPKKGLITDLDDTLWQGILGDDGVDGVAWGMDQHAQIHGFYQQLLHALAQSGVLVGVATKNDPALVEQALARPDLLVQSSGLYPVEAGWGLKSESATRILEAWNIGADSVVFIDDSPMEIDEVRRAHPDIECILFPKKDVEAVYRLGYRLRDLFGKREVREEDRIRSRSLQAAAPLRKGGSHVQMEEFLRDAKAHVAPVWKRPPLEPRVLELINKTNQFNINGRRYTEAEWFAYANQPAIEVLVVEYSDKYGPLGKIAALAGSRRGGRFRIDTWVMSCRAFSRRIEYHTIKNIFDHWDVEDVSIDFQRTDRNSPTVDFFTSLLGGPPDGPFSLSRTQFESHCPALYDSGEPSRVAETAATK